MGRSCSRNFPLAQIIITVLQGANANFVTKSLQFCLVYCELTAGTLLPSISISIPKEGSHRTLYKLFSSKVQEKKSDKIEVFVLIGGLKFQLRITGEEYYQNSLEAICGPHRRSGVNRLETAWLILGDKNNQNENAVRVEIQGRTVGYLTPEAAISYRQKLIERNTPAAVGRCQAVIKGGWISSDGRKGPFEVWLDTPPFDC